jgi:triphosphoribosyl-dephospho-CoA synthase
VTDAGGKATDSGISELLRDAFEYACLIEIAALKPGNVHDYAGGHGMTAENFRTSARVAAPAIAAPGISVGLRAAAAVAASWEAVQCNTNLGIVLLCAPLVHAGFAVARMKQPRMADVRDRLRGVLDGLTESDADFAFAAIRRANPAGLGAAQRHDVRGAAGASLLAAMREAAARDRIAEQYASGFRDVFETGVPEIEAARRRYADSPKAETWAASAAYLAFLAGFPDSHIARKHGPARALQVQREAKDIHRLFITSRDPEDTLAPLLAFDKTLKNRGLNPGTSADLTVAALLTVRLLDIFPHHTAGRTGGLAP